MANEQINQLAPLGLPVQGTDKLIVQRGAARATALEVQNSGLVTGPAAATNSAVALYDGVTGKLLKDGPVLGNSATRNIGTGAGDVAAGNAAPTAHKTSHENGGSDEISVAGLSGVLADPQPPIIGAGAAQAVAGNDARLTDARTPTAHAASHVTGGADIIQSADTTHAGLAPAVTAPAAGLLSVLAVGNGETVRTDKPLFDTTNPAALGVAAPGSQVIAARRDHVHAAPALGDLTDVDTTGVVVDQTLRYNGANWVPGTIPTSAGGAGQDFFHDQTSVTPSSTQNGFAIETLTLIPSGAAEVVESVALTNNTLVIDGYLGPVLGRTTIPSGTWEFDLFASVSSTGSGRITTCSRNIFQVVPIAGSTLETTGVPLSTSRTATITGGATPFVAGDANANQLLASWLQTPKGLYRITAFTSSTEVTIAVPAAYTNESGVAASRWKYLFGVTSDPITALTTSYARYFKQSFQQAFTIALTDRIGSIAFGTSNNTTTLNFVYQGTTRQTHFTAPTIVLHNDLPGLQGGTAGEYFHLTSAQATAATAAQAQATASIRAIGTGTPEAIGTAAAGNATTAAASNHVHAIPAGHVTLAMMANIDGTTAEVVVGRSTASSGVPELLATEGIRASPIMLQRSIFQFGIYQNFGAL